MASHADRLKMSKCFTSAEGSFNCISCHNPHVSVRKTKLLKFNQVCANCHQSDQPSICTEKAHIREAKNDNCVGCHMPTSGSTDIPHVTVHDHYIRKPIESSKMNELGEFLGLKAVNNSKPDRRSRALAYLQQYERFGGERFMLDSAAIIIEGLADTAQLPLSIHLYSLSDNVIAMRDLVYTYGSEYILKQYQKVDYLNRDAWLQYRVGEAFLRLSDLNTAQLHLQQAASLAPFILDFKVKLASCFNRLNNQAKARKLYEEILNERPLHKEALNNLGYLNMLGQDFIAAKDAFDLVLKHHPDYEQAWLNQAQLYILEENQMGVVKALQEVLRINPSNKKAQQILNQLKS
jgi:predicted CXXCH cytochrome family protein